MHILQAAFNNNLVELKKCLAKREDVNSREPDSHNTPLHYAIGNDNPDMVRVLLNAKADINKKNKINKSPLELAQLKPLVYPLLLLYQQQLEFPVYSLSQDHHNCCRVVLVHTQMNKPNLNEESIFLELSHVSRKTDEEKIKFSVVEIHQRLRLTIAKLPVNDGGNAIAVDISFEVKIDVTDKRFVITFPLKIPKISLFTVSDADTILNGNHNTREQLKYLFEHGKEQMGMAINDKHGHCPKYDNAKGDAQLVNHSEQALAAYLSTSAAANLLAKRLCEELYKEEIAHLSSAIKLYAVILHIHSHNAPCGACEAVLLGMQNDLPERKKNVALGKYHGFLEQIEAALLSEDIKKYYHFFFPKKLKNGLPNFVIATPGIRLFTTYSSDYKYAPHGKEVSYQPVEWHIENKISSYTIETRHYSQFIFTVIFQNSLNNAKVTTDFNQRTIFSSGSKNNSHVITRNQKITAQIKLEIEAENQKLTQTQAA